MSFSFPSQVSQGSSICDLLSSLDQDMTRQYETLMISEGEFVPKQEIVNTGQSKKYNKINAGTLHD